MSQKDQARRPFQRVRARGEEVRRFLLDNVAAHPADIASIGAKHFGISRQAIHKHLQRLVANGLLAAKGETRDRQYSLPPQSSWQQRYELESGLAEDVVWSEDIRLHLADLPKNVLDIWHHGFTEMLNNAIDHSSGTCVLVELTRTPVGTEILIRDDGVGIFRKIQEALGLLDERHALLELSKGKLTTDPAHHSGEGIFFSSRMFDAFQILSGETYFSHDDSREQDWLSESSQVTKGTAVFMSLSNTARRTTREIFDAYVSGDEHYFSKTVVPVALARYGEDQLISRSQAKRVLARVELFKTVIFDFNDVDGIGQAFADEIFRVFARRHPGIELTQIHAKPAVKKMIDRARDSNVIPP
jgi:anti-sigma regulatory factor (Ser/Thr protein kinase)/biotin operon repressor